MISFFESYKGKNDHLDKLLDYLIDYSVDYSVSENEISNKIRSIKFKNEYCHELAKNLPSLIDFNKDNFDEIQELFQSTFDIIESESESESDYLPLPSISVKIIPYDPNYKEIYPAPTCHELFPEYDVCKTCKYIRIRCSCDTFDYLNS
jgi:hypothetical protein